MKNNKIAFVILFAGLIVSSFIIIQKAIAETPSDIQYPIAELGNCKSETDCRSYCDKPENTPACLNFAEKNNLMNKSEIETARKFVATGNKGPGGCTSKDTCEAYCNDISHVDECVSFAEQNDIMPKKDLLEAKKVRDAIKRGVKPPACTSKKACDNYCEDSSHMEECITFASEAGLMGDKEKEDSQKMLQALKRGVKPPPCKGKEACDQYCQQRDNMEVCMNFAIEAGFMGEKEKGDAQKMLSAIKKGVKPPNCNGKEACNAYCQSDEHFDECTSFAEAAGFMDAKDAAMARKTKGKGPGGCKGKDECESFCNNKTNQETCFNFAKDNGMIPEEELQKMKEGTNRMKEDFGRMPSAVKDCLESALGSDVINKMQSGEFMPGPELGNQMKTCFDKMPRPSEEEMREGDEKRPPQDREFRRGPGGCSTPEECQDFCSKNPEQCKNIGQPGQEDELGEPGERRKPQEPEMKQQPGIRPMPPRPNEEEFERRNKGQMRPEDDTQNEFRQERMPQENGRFIPPPNSEENQPPPPNFDNQPNFEGQEPPQNQMTPPTEQIPQAPQTEQAPPPPPSSEQAPAPAPEPAPSSFLNNQYLGALIRFLIGDFQ